jgi:hypothetical protein
MYHRISIRISYTFWHIERLNIYQFNLMKMQLNSNKLLLCIAILLIQNVVLLQNEYTQRMPCLVKIQSERKKTNAIKNSGHWFEKLVKATFQNYDPNEFIPADKIKRTCRINTFVPIHLLMILNKLLQMYHGELVHYYLIFILQFGIYFCHNKWVEINLLYYDSVIITLFTLAE